MYTCFKCNKQYKLSSSLRRHLELEERYYVCLACDTQLENASKATLIRHLRKFKKTCFRKHNELAILRRKKEKKEILFENFKKITANINYHLELYKNVSATVVNSIEILGQMKRFSALLPLFDQIKEKDRYKHNFTNMKIDFFKNLKKFNNLQNEINASIPMLNYPCIQKECLNYRKSPTYLCNHQMWYI